MFNNHHPCRDDGRKYSQRQGKDGKCREKLPKGFVDWLTAMVPITVGKEPNFRREVFYESVRSVFSSNKKVITTVCERNLT